MSHVPFTSLLPYMCVSPHLYLLQCASSAGVTQLWMGFVCCAHVGGPNPDLPGGVGLVKFRYTRVMIKIKIKIKHSEWGGSLIGRAPLSQVEGPWFESRSPRLSQAYRLASAGCAASA